MTVSVAAHGPEPSTCQARTEVGKGLLSTRIMMLEMQWALFPS
jgi:hypothetical protein